MPCSSCNGMGLLHNTSPLSESEKQVITMVLKAVGPLLPSTGEAAFRLKPSQVRRVLAVQLYCQYRMRNHGKAASRKLASNDMYGHDRRHGIVKSEYRSFVLTKFLRKRISGGNRSKEAEVLSSFMDKMCEWLRAQKRGTVKPLGFARWVSNTLLEPALGVTSATEQGPGKRGPASMSIRTARRWLRALGWVYSADTKGAYTDGKCRDDVIAAHNKFISAMDACA